MQPLRIEVYCMAGDRRRTQLQRADVALGSVAPLQIATESLLPPNILSTRGLLVLPALDDGYSTTTTTNHDIATPYTRSLGRLDLRLDPAPVPLNSDGSHLSLSPTPHVRLSPFSPPTPRALRSTSRARSTFTRLLAAAALTAGAVLVFGGAAAEVAAAVAGRTVTAVLLTHGHNDHIGAAREQAGAGELLA